MFGRTQHSRETMGLSAHDSSSRQKPLALADSAIGSRASFQTAHIVFVYNTFNFAHQGLKTKD